MLIIFHVMRKWAVIFLIFSIDVKEVYTAAMNVSNTSDVSDEKIENEVKKPEPDRIKFFFYPNSQNISDTQEFRLDNPDSILNSNFSLEEPVKILIHGFNGDCEDLPFPLRPLEEYLLLKESMNSTANLICVDWGPWSRFDGLVNYIPTYILGRITYARKISQKVARLIVFLKDAKMIKSYSDIHIIGQSLGAHMAGAAGLRVAELSGQKVGRISGLDPAGPLYREWPDLDEQLDKSDAEFVDVYHTSMRRAGLEGKYGHVDFYVNGGVRQPSCSEPKPVIQIFATISEGIFGGCSHNIIGNYWADSIRNPEIKACRTDSYAKFQRIKSTKSGCRTEDTTIFGENIPTSARGKFFLDLDAKYTPDVHTIL